ncbi:hypothetical protein [Metamycoplasma gateae]|uniref:Uncharacterized protein n=1 Tax=Metamycoplasma gateae TaxID=35769 RepID=A0ABZ2AIJ7_9BACT|nr:hypothetical protein V2E26_02790 [Metamycoplasma gateae]
MKLKYVLTSELNGQKDDVVQTDFVDFFEDNSTEFTHIEFTDEKVMNCVLDVKNDEVKISYAAQKMHMRKNEFINNKLMISETDFIPIDVYLIDVKISMEEISFTYDLLQNKKIIIRNTAKLIFSNN